MAYMKQTIKLVRCGVLLAFSVAVYVTLSEIMFEPKPVYILRNPTKDREKTSRIEKSSQKLERLELPTILNEKKEQKKYHLLINAYMNSGSRFTGSLFGFRKEAFYFYEPLWRASVWDYFRAPNLLCSTVVNICENMTASYINRWIKIMPDADVPRDATVSDLLLKVLEKVYRCDFSHLEAMVVSNIAHVASLSGPSWDSYRSCVMIKKTKSECIKHEEALCRRSPHIVTKVLRLTVGGLEPLLWTLPNLKIIQLFRDPRAIMNSRINSRYPQKDFRNTTIALCRKMIWDLQEGKKLLKKYPDRFKFVFYEDMTTDPVEKTELLSNFIGMDFNKTEVELLNTVKVNKAFKDKQSEIPDARVDDNAYWWKSTLPKHNLTCVQEECREFFDTFGLELF